MKRLWTVAFIALITSGVCAQDRPNIILIMTDDQGIGDLGVTGNPVIETPNIDRLASQSATMTTFYVSPVCTPTRASLMTGRYNYRTRAIDTYIGRAMMDPEEVTLAEALKSSGYATALFGKWHLGDNYPLRPQDQGFDEVLCHRGGGIGQPSDPQGGEGKYTDPILFHNGVPTPLKGYCCDLYFDFAMNWFEGRHRAGRPFFAYIASNTPHGPFHDVPADLLAKYQAKDLSQVILGKASAQAADQTARIFAMVENVDQNVGRLMKKLDDMGIADNTIVIFLTDNGPNGKRYVMDLRGSKSDVESGGIRTSFFLRWPARVKAGSKVDAIAAHIDVMPTLLDASGTPAPKDIKLDGRSFLPMLTGAKNGWDDDRAVFTQTHRGDAPVRYHHVSVQTQKWKMIHPSGFGAESFDGTPKWELYDIEKDHDESENLAAQHPEIIKDLKTRYDAWFDDVSSTRPDNYAPPLIVIGTPFENPTVLTRQDWRHIQGKPWAKDSNGFWLLRNEKADRFDVRLRFPAAIGDGDASLQIGEKIYSAKFPIHATQVWFRNLDLPAGEARLLATLGQNDKGHGPWQVDVIQH